MAKENKINILIKGNIHTDILMKVYLRKEFGLIRSKRLSHIWHMTIGKNKKIADEGVYFYIFTIGDFSITNYLELIR